MPKSNAASNPDRSLSDADSVEVPFLLEGDAAFLSVVFETLDAHLDRTLAPYEGFVIGADAIDAGSVDTDEQAAIRMYVELEADDDPDDVIDDIDGILDELADEHDMTLARQSVEVVLDAPDRDAAFRTET